MAKDEVIYIPGDRILFDDDDMDSAETAITIGPGLKRLSENLVIATSSGRLNRRSPRTYWIDTQSKRYVPVVDDRVIGIVTQKLGMDGWKVEIGCADSAYLHFLSFEGASKKNRPNLKEGTAIYCRVKVAIKDMDPEVVCFDSEEKARGMGPLPSDGFLFHVPLNTSRKLLSPDFKFLDELGRQFKFEITCGMNGRIWIKTGSTKLTNALANSLSNAHLCSSEGIPELVQKTVDYAQGFHSWSAYPE